jgi:hypothetical protein
MTSISWWVCLRTLSIARNSKLGRSSVGITTETNILKSPKAYASQDDPIRA